ncbi:phosphate/phosphite/phosphonate ABC transporter substrate-binding protein [Thiomicrorhabdus sp. 6S2-11]|uniref:Phosphate/phosphite/phosphonate ABC transporter substrate-binding protein n=1 Tax=Thiomicrorhabdus marina TaxID=2818442 RepID=A0ABS3Q4A4_9GAMM|nr:phosphate/phosphite/phosphonate ABC transporter substrate-binding protein [Thiomicrorhabdus marina]MBO1926933.1 phosphate/phosphite/phosphonate ABC transporter substrate-binding protein [Thiomicrorhabdus marina]
MPQPLRFSRRLLLGTLATAVIGLTACSRTSDTPEYYQPKTLDKPRFIQAEYSFAVHPLHNPSRLFEVFNPLMEYLNNHIPHAYFRLEASRDYPTFDRKLAQASVDFALPNPYQTVTALKSKRYHVIAKMGDDQNFRGIILVRKDSGINKISDLRGKTISYPAPTALAATMLPQYFLQQNGLDIKHDLTNQYVGSQESSIMNVFHGEVDAAATWPPPWELLSQQRPELKRQLRVQWQTNPLPNNAIIVRDDIPTDVGKQVQYLLTNLHTSEQGRKILAGMYLSKFEIANNQSYEPVKQFLEDFQKTVRNPQDEI